MNNFLHKHKGKIDGKKIFHTVSLIIVGFIAVVLAFWYYQETKKTKDATDTISTSSTTVYDETASWYKLKNSEYGFEIKYLGDVLTKQEYTADFTQYLSENLEATKLISTARVDLIGNQQCYYGQSGIATVCNVANEGGILIVPMIMENMNTIMSALNKDFTPTELSVSGKKAYKYEMGVEGEGEDSYYIKINSTQGLLISRVYVDTFKPDPTFFLKILSTLEFTK